MMMTSIIPLAFCVTFFQTQVSSKALYSFKTDHDLQNIQFHGDDVFLGATNIIYRMNANLVQLRRKLTGPVNESTGCLAEKPCLGNNSNLVLLLYGRNSNSKLLTCGTFKNGICHVRNLKTLNIESSSTRALQIEKGNPDKVVSLISGGNKLLHVGMPSNGKEMPIRGNCGSMLIDDLASRNFLKFSRGGPIKFSAQYHVRYVSIFNANGYIYFTTVQQVELSSRSYHSKIVRYCKEGLVYNSYTEIPLSCQDKSQNEYNILVDGSFVNVSGKSASFFNASDGESLFVGIFSKSAGESQTDGNAVCVFTLKEVNRAFDRNVKLCVEYGVPAKGNLLPWDSKEDAALCKKRGSNVGDLFCGSDAFTKARDFPLGGSIPSNNTHVFSVPGKPTSIQAYSHIRGFTLFLGSADGTLSKYAVSTDKDGSASGLYQYGQDSVVANSPVKKVIVGPNNLDLYALTRRQISKYDVRACSQRISCKDCLSGPYCGWCALENKCSLKEECKNAAVSLYFIDDTDDKCPEFHSFQPSSAAMSVTQNENVSWKIKNIPTLKAGQTFNCSFGKTLVTASVSSNEVSCKTPKFGEIPGTDTSKTTTVKVALLSPVAGIVLANNTMVFYNCKQISRCLECTRFKYKCNWCSSGLTCEDNINSCASHVPHAGPDQLIKFSKCPRITGMGTTHVSNGVDRQVTVYGLNLPEAAAGFKYTCNVAIEGNGVNAAAERLSKEIVRCSKHTYNYVGEVANYTASVSVLYGGKKLDAITDTNVILYKCDYKRDDCSICLDAPKIWQCGWCNKKSCSVSDACKTNWINGSCPSPPRIIDFNPKAGAIFGNTKLKIDGRDLGTTVGDVANVTVAGQSCQFLTHLYVPSKTVYCKTVSVENPASGFVQMFVKFGEKMIRIKSSLLFDYKEPSVNSFEPTKGPCSGGTELSIHGTNLHVGDSVTVTVAGNPCNSNKRISPDKIVCTISSSCSKRRRRAAGGISISFDGHSVTPITNTAFSIEPDPVVTSINTYKLSTADSQELQTFVSGGQIFLIKGKGFDLIQKPKMKFTVYPERKMKHGRCVLKSPERLNCVAPNITEITGMINNTVTVELGFLMQHVVSVERIRNITVRGDPYFYKFDGITELTTRNLVLKGTNLDLLGNEDVNVTVAGLPCIVQNIRQTLFCISPNISSVEKRKQSEKALVKVRVGIGGLEYTLGYVRYIKSKYREKPFPWLYVYIAGAIAAVFILVIITLGILYRRRRKKEKKYQKVYQTRLENLESRYARECKEAFAELQTEMTDLTTDMSTSSIPYLRFETYAMRLLFPGIETHPIMDRDCNKSDTWKRCMSSLCELLKEKDFLLIFIKTLESQHSFAMRDRCKMASLLIVALQDDIKYVTDILQELLSDLIERSVDSGRGKLLLRRTESVAEKLLTNWLSYTLHEFLQQRVGEPLFRLFTAIVSLLDKEPVDAIACEARNSLSEDRLLRQKVDFKTIMAHVEYDGDDMIQVQLLDCDSINQAKVKILNVIYKNVPFSQRPNKDSLVLVYLTPTGGEKILHQEDSTCEIDGEWKRINTLEHFLIPDGCQLKLVPFAIYSDGTGTPVFHETSLQNVNFMPSHSSTPMLNNHHHNDSTYKLWHLVKSSDYPMEREDVRQNKMMAEVYLTRLLKTKGTLQHFVDELFEAVFAVARKGTPIPPAMKFLFDFLDKQAALLNITDGEVLHTWKNNCLPLKFWINVVKNPNFVFDVHKTSIVDSCLSVVAQLFMDSCSPEEHRLGKDSPSNKLLYAKEIPEYKKKVARFYAEVKSLPPASDKELVESFSEISDRYGEMFNHFNAGSEILSYAVKYKVKIMDALENEDLEEYANKLQDIMESLPDD